MSAAAASPQPPTTETPLHRNPKRREAPRVVACGLRHFQSNKSGLTFPAFLVRLPAPADRSWCTDGTQQKIGSRETQESYRWRAKVDFLRLSRAASRHGKVNEKTEHGLASLSFPKRAYANLCSSASSVPWIRPDVDDDETTFLQREVNIEGFDGGMGFEPRMKKNLLQLDQFLERAFRMSMDRGGACSGENGNCATATCRSRAPIFATAKAEEIGEGQERSRKDISLEKEREDDRMLREAWGEFGRDADTDNLILPPPACLRRDGRFRVTNTAPTETSHSSLQEDTQTTKVRDLATNHCNAGNANLAPGDDWERQKKAARLGQYFASDANATKLVNKMICLLQSAIDVISCGNPSRPDPSCWDDVIFVEPSCGDGRILSHLLHTVTNCNRMVRSGPEHNYGGNAACGTVGPHFVGYDIDPNAVSSCSERLSSQSNEGGYPAGKMVAAGGSVSISLKCQDFLKVTRHELWSDLKIPENEDTSRFRVVCIGGPPYTSGSGSGPLMERDLPERFVLHCARELRAELIVFLLPRRYRDCADRIRNVLNDGRAIVDADLDCHEEGDAARRMWEYRTEVLESSTFDFCGREVVQPSILQCWFRGGSVVSKTFELT